MSPCGLLKLKFSMLDDLEVGCELYLNADGSMRSRLRVPGNPVFDRSHSQPVGLHHVGSVRTPCPSAVTKVRNNSESISRCAARKRADRMSGPRRIRHR